MSCSNLLIRLKKDTNLPQSLTKQIHNIKILLLSCFFCFFRMTFRLCQISNIFAKIKTNSLYPIIDLNYRKEYPRIAKPSCDSDPI